MSNHLTVLSICFLLLSLNYILLGWFQSFTHKRSKSTGKPRIRRSLLLPFSIILVATTLNLAYQDELYSYFNWPLAYKILMVLTVAWSSWAISHALFRFLYLQLDIQKEDNLRSRKIQTQLLYIERLVDIGIGFLAVVALMLTFDGWYEFGRSLLTSAGILSLIIGLAAQKYLGNLISGFQIAFTQPMRIDDAVVVENEWGWIEEITLTYVVVRIWDLRRLVLPISYFTDKPFQNWTRTNAEVIGTVNLRVNFSTDVDAVREKLIEILNGTELWNRNVQVVQVTECDERSMTLRILVSSYNSPKCWDLRCLVREELIKFLSEDQNNLPQQRWVEMPKVL